MYVPRPWVLFVSFVCAGLLGLGAYFMPVFQAASAVTGGGTNLIPNAIPAAPTQPFTVLLLASDDDAKFPVNRIDTQSMILVRVDPTAKTATMLSIPRDLWVPMNGWMGKIGIAFQTGGVKGAIAIVEWNFKVHIDNWAWIGLKGMVKLIDSLGGVDLIVTNPVNDDFYPKDIDTNDPYAYYRVALLPGAVHLDGVHALQYARTRHGDLRGDFARSERQQQLLLAIKAKASHLNATDLPMLAQALNGEIKTDIDFGRLQALFSMSGQFTGPGVQTIVLLPPFTTQAVVEGQDVVLPDWSRILPLVHKSFP